MASSQREIFIQNLIPNVGHSTVLKRYWNDVCDICGSYLIKMVRQLSIIKAYKWGLIYKGIR